MIDSALLLDGNIQSQLEADSSTASLWRLLVLTDGKQNCENLEKVGRETLAGGFSCFLESYKSWQ